MCLAAKRERDRKSESVCVYDRVSLNAGGFPVPAAP